MNVSLKVLRCFYNKRCIVLVAEVHDNVNNPKYAVEKLNVKSYKGKGNNLTIIPRCHKTKTSK